MKLTGDKEITAKLNAIAEALATDILRKAAENGAFLYQQAISDAAPLGDDPPHIANNIEVQELKADAPRSVLMAIGPAPEFFYGSFLEFGTRRQAATPFMRPAWDHETDNALDEAAQVVRDELGMT